MKENNCVLITPEGHAVGRHIGFADPKKEVVSVIGSRSVLIIEHKNNPFLKNLANFSEAALCLCYDEACDHRADEEEGNNEVVNSLLVETKFSGNCLIALSDGNGGLAPMTPETVSKVIDLLEEYHGANLD